MRLTRRGVALMEQQAASTPETAAAWNGLAECIRTPRVRDAGPPLEASSLEWIEALSNFFEHLLRRLCLATTPNLGRVLHAVSSGPIRRAGGRVAAEPRLGANTPGEQPTRIQWLDPACGSGVFLVACAPLLRDSNLQAQASLEGWDLSPASCCAAQVLTRLAEGRAQVSHCDALTQSILPDNHVHACVVLGNPPYGNFGENKTNPWMQQLLQRYKNAGEERKCNLNDTAIQFLRWAEHHLHAQTAGVLALVLNNTFLDGVTHGRVRQSLMETFAQIFVLDLHGSSIKRETQAAHPGHRKDENVFVAVRQGVCVLFAAKGPGVSERESGLWRYDLRGIPVG